MVSKTTNSYGNITINDKAIALVVFNCTQDCYGVVNLVAKDIFESFIELFSKSYKFAKGVKIKAIQNRIVVDVFVILKHGVSINAVAKSIMDSIKYNVEDFTGMIVDSVNVHVMGVRV